MKKSKDKPEGKGTLKARILDFIEEKGSANLSQLVRLGNSRNSVIYHIKRLHAENKIRAFIKGTGFTDEERCFSIAPGDYPQEILDIKKIIEHMCNDDTNIAAPAYEEFVNLCVQKNILRDDAIALAYALISGRYPQLKEKTVFILTIPNWKGTKGTMGDYKTQSFRGTPGYMKFEDFIKPD